MITINFQNIFGTKIKQEEFEQKSEKLPDFLEKIHNKNLGFYQIFDDSNFQTQVKEIEIFAKSLRQKFSHFVVLGMGGSALGFEVIQKIFEHKSDKTFKVLKNIDPATILELEETFPLEKTGFIVVSKSGTTVETISEFLYFKTKVPAENFVFVSEKDSFLHKTATEMNCQFFEMPNNIGGRFSVLTAVGMLPSAILGVNIHKILAGGKSMAKNFQSEKFTENVSFKLATAQFIATKKNLNTHVLWTYSEKIKSFGFWVEQLLAESTGKKGSGITPLIATGVTDQHSTLQNFVEGIDNKFFLFLRPKSYVKTEKIQAPEKFNFINGKKFSEIMDAEFRGTRDSLTEKNCPNLTIEIDEISEFTLGELFMLFECKTAFLGEFFKINAFDQPGVERSKVLTKEFLTKTKINL
ncbi:MAG: hypothetical protein OEL89_02170 [Candidatus Peregrinibacteria bacterium]|nr:hypothetical protein [Candidatus Peregrinibacteria bacterium]